MQVGSPMPGAVEKVLVTAGQHVNAGDVLCTVSAMKMEVLHFILFPLRLCSLTMLFTGESKCSDERVHPLD